MSTLLVSTPGSSAHLPHEHTSLMSTPLSSAHFACLRLSSSTLSRTLLISTPCWSAYLACLPVQLCLEPRHLRFALPQLAHCGQRVPASTAHA
eukprot:1138987-Pelagomonas_calceolata.AAC.6